MGQRLKKTNFNACSQTFERGLEPEIDCYSMFWELKIGQKKSFSALEQYICFCSGVGWNWLSDYSALHCQVSFTQLDRVNRWG